MKRSLKVVATLVLALAMLFSVLGGCAGNKTNDQTTASTQAAQDTKTEASTQAEAAKPELITFDMYVNYQWWTFQYPFDGSDPITKWIIDNKGVKINHKWPTGDEREMLNLMIAADNLPDVIVMDRDDMWKKMIALDKLVSIDEYLDKYSGYKNAVSDETRGMTKIDGKNWGILNYPNSKEWLGFGQVPVINDKIYKQLGSPKLDTFDDLLAYLEAVKKADIKVDGKPVIPLQFTAGSTSAADGYALWASWGDGRLSDEYYDVARRPVTDGKLDLTLKDPKFKDNILFHQKLYSSGYVNKDAFVEKKDQTREKMNTGRVAVFVGLDSLDLARDGNNALKKAGSDITYSAIAPFVAPGADRNTIRTNGKSTVGWNIVCITKKAKNPERIYEYLDWVCTNEGQSILQYGPKGTNWNEVDADGYPIILPGKALNQTKEFPIQYFTQPAMTVFCDKSKIRINETLPAEQQDWGTTQQVKLEAWKYVADTTQFDNLQPVGGTEVGQIYSDGSTYIKDQLVKMVTAKTPQDTEKILQQTIDELAKRGFDKVVSYENEQWQINKVKMGIK